MMRVRRLSDVCLSVAYIGPKSRTERPIGRLKLAPRQPCTSHVTWTPFSRPNGQRSTCMGRGHIVAASRTACLPLIMCKAKHKNIKLKQANSSIMSLCTQQIYKFVQTHKSKNNYKYCNTIDNLKGARVLLCNLAADIFLSFEQFTLSAYAQCTGSNSKDLTAISVSQSSSKHMFITRSLHQHLSVIGFVRFATIACVDPAYCRCRPNTDYRLQKFVTLVHVPDRVYVSAKTRFWIGGRTVTYHISKI